MLRLTFTALAVAVLFTDHSDAQTHPHITGFFTSVEYIRGAGDVLGMEVWIVYARGSYWDTVQLAEVSPNRRSLYQSKSLVNGLVSRFPLPCQERRTTEHGNPTRFDGEVNRAELKGKFGRDEVRLKRGTSYWQ